MRADDEPRSPSTMTPPPDDRRVARSPTRHSVDRWPVEDRWPSPRDSPRDSPRSPRDADRERADRMSVATVRGIQFAFALRRRRIFSDQIIALCDQTSCHSPEQGDQTSCQSPEQGATRG
mmetsp:Transcript_19707/g.59626  ORF Transcript_19707/g.59626 Transcript_19707/m.59626 type:complete len:120 (-) Transcript_19707:116-475(-)